MRRLVAATILFVTAACAGPPLPSEEPRAKTSKRTGKHGSEAVREAEDPERVSNKGKDWDGWRYGGSRDDCFFVVGRTCFSSKVAACKAAKCGGKSCVADGGGPATIASLAARPARVIAVVVAGLYLVPYAGYLLYPVLVLATVIHELGHALAVVVTGGAVATIALAPDGGAVTVHGGAARR
ncbi:MAG: M50 family metallopeptidase [Myxococcales bacterium]|nr:M50 family metallopeptidase [Myxococcales bacterium]